MGGLMEGGEMDGCTNDKGWMIDERMDERTDAWTDGQNMNR